ncbi:MAG: hypothetical protein ACRD4K_10690, partial [Candidatus Acidiferrales bacterium]
MQTLQSISPLDPLLVRLLEAASARRPLTRSATAELMAQTAADAGGAGREYAYQSGVRENASASRATESARGPAPPFPSQPGTEPGQFPGNLSWEKIPGEPPTHSPFEPADQSSSSASLPKPRVINLQWGISIAFTIVVLLVAGYIGYRKFAAPSSQPETAANPNPLVAQPPPPRSQALPSAVSSPPASQGPSTTLQYEQRRLIDLARTAADAKDYKAAQALIDEASKLKGPFNSQAEELRQRLSGEAARGTEAPEPARQEKTFWDQAMKEMDGGQLDDADQSFRKILLLPEASRNRPEAEKYVDQTIPLARRQADLWAQAQKLSDSQEVGHLAALLKVVDQLLALGGPHQAEAQKMRDFVFQQFARANARKNNLPPPKFVRSERGNFDDLESQFAQAVQQGNAQALGQLQDLRLKFLAIVSGGGPLVNDARDYANIVIPNAQKQIEDRLSASETGATANAEYEKAVKDYAAAVSAQNLNLLRSRVLPELQKIAQSGSPR